MPFALDLRKQLLLSGFDVNNPMQIVTPQTAASTTAPPSPFILGWVAFRGQILRITLDGHLYESPRSEGSVGDAFDGATDDAQALLNVILSTVATADASRIAVRGGSRGGTVALLLAERDARVRRAISVVGPTDMLRLTQTNQEDRTYQLQFLQELKEGRQTLAEARQRLLASFPLYFAQRLPLTQLHLGSQDRIVPPPKANYSATNYKP